MNEYNLYLEEIIPLRGKTNKKPSVDAMKLEDTIPILVLILIVIDSIPRDPNNNRFWG